MRYAFIKVGIPTTETDRQSFLQRVKFSVASCSYSFQEWIDNVLRRKMTATHSSMAPFDNMYHQSQSELSKLDVRIYFGLNQSALIGSTTSLPFKIYHAKSIEGELDIAARVFCNDYANLVVSTKEKVLKLSKIVAWNLPDFGESNAALFETVSRFLEGSQLSSLRDMVQAKIRFVDPDWTRNAVDFAKFEKEAVKGEVAGIKAVLLRFRAPRIPANEKLRMATLRSLNVLDTLPEERFDRITRMVQDEYSVPFVFISLVDADRQWFKSIQWACPAPSPSEAPRKVSFCGHTILGRHREILEIPDILEDDRFADNPLAIGLQLRYYAGIPLVVPSSVGDSYVNVGTLCILDTKPRKLNQGQLTKLDEFGEQVRDEILRRTITSTPTALASNTVKQ
jgi:hypothetical protein